MRTGASGVCAVVGCPKPVYARLHCTTHYSRLVRGRSLLGPPGSQRTRACRRCGAAWCPLPGRPQPTYCSVGCRSGVVHAVDPLEPGTLARVASVLVMLERRVPRAAIADHLGVSIQRVDQLAARGRAWLAEQVLDALEEADVLTLGQAARSIGVPRQVLAQVTERQDRFTAGEVRRLRHELLLGLLARHAVRGDLTQPRS